MLNRTLALLLVMPWVMPWLGASDAHAGNGRRLASRLVSADAKSRPGQDTEWTQSTTTRTSKYVIWDSGRFLGSVTTLHLDRVTGEEIASTQRSFQTRVHRNGVLELLTPPRLLRTTYETDRGSRTYSVNKTLLRE